MRVAPLDLPLPVIQEELNKLRHPLRIAITRAKNPFNIGAIIRVAHSFLVAEIILIGDAPYYERAAMGMQRYENITHVKDEATFLEKAKTEQWSLVAFEKDHAQWGLWDAPMPREAVLVFGNEDEGIRQSILDASHSIVGIPMYGINHSYPVTAAAAMAMAEWARRYAHLKNA
ncbi:MAG: TrmH family RNA methyltransferase [Myxococcales bacterium]|nr:TrmH family RNA methyltransferase [Myxococcales bacterium]MCB9708913.1 TrmH family RNA methyltransferase [Myxococcales bacterium]